jgi:hypothetical protein
MNLLIQLKTTPPLLITLALLCLALSPQARAVCQQGCDADNAFLGEDALLNNTTGFGDTAIGNRGGEGILQRFILECRRALQFVRP